MLLKTIIKRARFAYWLIKTRNGNFASAIFCGYRTRRVLRSSRLFDGSWYLSHYPEIGSRGFDPLDHYVAFGLIQRRDPNPLFSAEWYILNNPEVTSAHINPLLHYIERGAGSGCDPHPLFDTQWYLSEHPIVLKSGKNALIHYIETGAAMGWDPNPMFDTQWYLSETSQLPPPDTNPLIHYIEIGAKCGKNPHPLFDAQWYSDEHALDGSQRKAPLAHYFSFGVKTGCDPNPLFDTKTYLKENNVICSVREAARHFYESNMPLAKGAYRSEQILQAVQNAYRAKTDTHLVRSQLTQPARCAVYLQCGAGSIHRQWLTDAQKPWDLIVNHYDPTFVGSIDCCAEFVQRGEVPGTKFTSFNTLLRQFPEIVFPYNYVLLLDDDVAISEGSISALFNLAEYHGLDLLQPSLTRESYALHSILITTGRSGLRYLSGIEIMMPVLSRRTLSCGAHIFGQSVSGWGIDIALGKLMTGVIKAKAAVVDDICAEHRKPIDVQDGAYYRMLYRQNIFPWLEARYLKKAYNADYTFKEIPI